LLSAAYLPAGMAPELCSKTCVYNLPPDEDFILDELPTSPLITVSIGASHAAKDAGLSRQHPALTDPSFRLASAD
jgi:sarcosine oxidase